MSEAAAIHAVLPEFRKRHPKEEGWLIFIDDESIGAWGSHLNYLPAFLRFISPRPVLREDIWTSIGWRECGRSTRIVFTERPFRRRGSGFGDANWGGEIEVLWKGVPIHYKQEIVETGSILRTSTTVTFIATKDRRVLEDFTMGFGRFYKAFLRERTSKILTIAHSDMHSSSIPKPRLNWSDLILPNDMGESIRRDFESFLIAKKQYQRIRLPYRRGLLFAGPPGCGKTLTTKIIASQFKRRVIALVLTADIDDKDLARAFATAEREAPSVLILEDLDRLADSKTISMSHLLNMLDGLRTPKGVLVIATSNQPEKLDRALLHRPSRFDRVWGFPLPGFRERLEMMRRKGLGEFPEGTLQEAARQSDGFTMAYAQEAVVNALLTALYEGRRPSPADLLESARTLKKQYKLTQKVTGNLPALTAVGFNGDQEEIPVPSGW